MPSAHPGGDSGSPDGWRGSRLFRKRTILRVENIDALSRSYLGPRASMESYSVDIDPAQVVRWVRAEHERSPSTLKISARRSREVREIPARPELHLGDEEREDLTEIATVATLEIAPARAADGWLLRVVVEDEVGPRISAGEPASAAEQPIDLGAFYHEFIAPGRGNASITGEVESPASKAHLAYLLQMIEKNSHVSEQGVAR